MATFLRPAVVAVCTGTGSPTARTYALIASDPMNTLADAAFGERPGLWPLPSSGTAEEHWFRAVAAGGQGRYASALAELELVRRVAGGSRWASLASTTRASFLRQLGWHGRARIWDGHGLAAAGDDAEAWADAATGLAADALGTGRFALSDRLLKRADDAMGATTSARLPVRGAWVSAELAMATGRGADAVGHAERAVELASAFGSVRHAVKSDVVLAAALCSAGSTDRARRVADTVLVAAEQYDLVPLTWALSCLLGDIGSATRSPEDVAALRSRCVDAVRERGGTWA